MTALLLTLVALFIAGYLFYAAPAVEIVPALELVLLLLLGTLFLILSIQTVRRRAERIARERISEVAPSPATAPPPETAVAADTAVAQFLGRLQEKGRLVDFVMDDITRYPDPQVAAAARVVHQGCREVLHSSFDLQPVHAGPEGETVTLGGDYDPRRYRLVGHVPDRAPFQGAVRHRGWRTGRITLPRAVGTGEGAREIIVPAEVEMS